MLFVDPCTNNIIPGFQNITAFFGGFFFTRFRPHVIHPSGSFSFRHFNKFLEKFFATVLKAQAYFKKQTVPNPEIDVTFNDYIQEEEKKYTVEEVEKLIALGVITTEQGKELLGLDERFEDTPVTEEEAT